MEQHQQNSTETIPVHLRLYQCDAAENSDASIPKSQRHGPYRPEKIRFRHHWSIEDLKFRSRWVYQYWSMFHAYLSVYLSVCLSVVTYVGMFVCMSVILIRISIRILMRIHVHCHQRGICH